MELRSYMELNIFKEIAEMSLELLGLLLQQQCSCCCLCCCFCCMYIITYFYGGAKRRPRTL